MAQEDTTSISTSTDTSTTSASTSSVPVPAPTPVSVPVLVPDASDVAAVNTEPLTTSTNSVPPPTSSTSPPPPPPPAPTPAPTPAAAAAATAADVASAPATAPLPGHWPPSSTPNSNSTPSAETLSTASATLNASIPATAPPPPATGPATAPAPAPAPVVTPVPPLPQQNGQQNNQQNGDARASSSPAMSHHHQPPGHQRGYPSPNNFSSPGAVPPNQYAYHPQQGQAPADPYRAGAGAPVPSLPSMKSLDHHYQQGAPPPQAMPMQMQMAPNQGMQYYLPPGVQGNPYMTQDLNHLRYQIPHHDPRLMRGPGGPKKEIKRRTKTGCLTCRKRRIKCDEAHPTCNNCKKSKRECLGYDPIFKQQPGPSAIQPAPNAQRVPTPTVPSIPSSVPPTVPTVPSTPTAPPVPVPVSSSNPYGAQPAILPSSYNPPPATAATPSHSHSPLDPALTSATPGLKTEATYDFAAPIDPALQTLPAPATVPSTQTQSFPGEQRAAGFDNHLRATTRMKFDDLIGLLGPAAPTQDIALTPELLTEIINIYREVYAVGLQAFFESNWFQKQDAQGKFFVENSQPLLAQFASFLKVVQSVPANDHTQMAHSGVLETRLIWSLATLPCSSAPPSTNVEAKVLPPPDDLTEAANRVRVLEALLCGDFLPSNFLAPPVPDANPHRQQEFEFWHNLAQYLCHHDAAKRDEILGRLRLQLGGRENRDLIYSIAISRELSPRVEAGFERNIPKHLDESDPKNRLWVANKFIQDEAQVTGGTTNIVRRFSEIAIRAYISPGVNIATHHGSPAVPAQP
ncbi:putative transcriptional regulatory protein C15D4.02 [Colletotrichum higginsianum]|uniref:Putative transcriptional regulatory protein C15D4.02 n=1 Tax=Colletotrichum higginsianum TaxID=80884 RepID=A0A4T0WF73_9PEZI|nr:putative transcriptional regulatory protein C15D4.02 [Colletotrichum higginsianum]